MTPSPSTTVRLTDARFEADITPGASVSFTAASLEADPRKRALECARASAAVNGGVVATAVAVAISFQDVVFGEGDGGAVQNVRETFAREEKGAKRRSVDVTATSPARAAARAGPRGRGARGAGGRGRVPPRPGEGESVCKKRAATRAPPPTGTRATSKSPCASSGRSSRRRLTRRSRGPCASSRLCWSRRWRGRAPGTPPSASLPPRPPARRERRRRSGDAPARVRRGGARAARRAEGAAFADEERPARDGDGASDGADCQTAEEQETLDEERVAVAAAAAVSAAGAVTLGHGSVLAFVFGGDAKRAEAAATSFIARVGHRSGTVKKKSGFLAALEIKRAFVATCDLRDAAVRVPGAPAPLFAAKRLRVTSPVAQARFRSRGSRDAAERERRRKKLLFRLRKKENRQKRTVKNLRACSPSAAAGSRRRSRRMRRGSLRCSHSRTRTRARRGSACATPCTASQPWFRSCANLFD